MLVKQDLWPAELSLWNDVVGAEVAEGCRAEAGADQAMNLSDRQIRSQLICQLATNRRDERMCGSSMIYVTDKEIVGDLDLEASRLLLPLRFDHCVIGDINLDQAEVPGLIVTDSEVGSLTARQIQTGNILLMGTTVIGPVLLVDAHVRGVLNIRGARFANRGTALHCHNIKVDGDLLADGFTACGEVNLTGARVGGYLELTEVTLSNTHGPALRADGLSVTQDMLSQHLTAHGEVRLRGAQITGTLDLAEAEIESTNKEVGHALSADALTVGRDMDCRAIKVDGQLRLPGAHIHARLDLGGARITNVGAKKALFARGLEVNEDVKCNNGFKAYGGTILASAKIGGKLDLSGGAFYGLVNLDSATVHRLIDTEMTWPKEVILSDFEYDSFKGIDDKKSVKNRLKWLQQVIDSSGYSPQIYNTLAAAYRADGQDDAVRKVLIAKVRARSAARKGIIHLPGRLWNLLLRWTIGYGYRPARILWLLAAAMLLGWFRFDGLHDGAYLELKQGAGSSSDFQSGLYTLDLLLPVAGFGQRQNFIAHGAAIWVNTSFILMGWFVGLVLVAGLSGVFKRD